jgi:hypothetical protein
MTMAVAESFPVTNNSVRKHAYNGNREAVAIQLP